MILSIAFTSILSRIAVDLHAFPRDQTIEKWYNLDDTDSAILLLITVSGSHSKDTVVDLTEFNQNDVRNAIVERYDLLHTFDDMKDIGQLTVKVFRAEDLIAKDIGGKSDPFAVLELVNTRLQTHTEYRTLNPQWNKLFTFSVKDIHTCLDVTVYDEDPNNKFEFLGKISIPLMSVCYFSSNFLSLS
ncbi:C2 domain protein [Dictyocaulus viviparus]|uniref:C2 domain protein n=1 Tax=Dictyocaulus viviparus TaxID=29172 RepID=A0A0D8XBL9_DICVI|nr:C2 domain protein [Dictyocaulus viviparus]